jgi:hypothetical protein
MSVKLLRRFMVPALVIAAGAIACADTVEPEPEEEPEVATMRLTVGGATIDVEEDGTVTGGPITISATTTISAAWLRADGTADPSVDAAEFELLVEIDDESILTFTRTSAFAGTLTKVAAGATTADFALFHLEEMHEDFGPFTVSIVVN